MLKNVYAIYTGPLSVQAQYSRFCPISSTFRYSGSLFTSTVACLTAAKFKPLTLYMLGFALSNFANIFTASFKVKVTLRLTVCQSVSLGIEPHLGPMTRYLFLSDSYVLVSVGSPLWREDGSVFCMCRWLLPAQPFSGPSPLGLATVFYCVRFETSLFVASSNSQGHGGGIRLRHHTGDCQLESESESYVTTDSQSVSLSWYKAPIWAYDQIFIAIRNTEYVGQLRVCWYGALSLTRGRVCRLQLLLVLASAVILGSESLGTRDHIYCLRFETYFVRHSR
jgi:hypothetical protein